MNTDKNVITLLGTGNAHAMRCYNTCFTLCSSGGSVLLVDAGGGNGILNQMEKVNLKFVDLHDIFVTHAHTDHLLGVVWVIRMALEEKQCLRVWSHRKVLNLLNHICRQILPSKEATDPRSPSLRHRTFRHERADKHQTK